MEFNKQHINNDIDKLNLAPYDMVLLSDFQTDDISEFSQFMDEVSYTSTDVKDAISDAYIKSNSTTNVDVKERDIAYSKLSLTDSNQLYVDSKFLPNSIYLGCFDYKDISVTPFAYGDVSQICDAYNRGLRRNYDVTQDVKPIPYVVENSNDLDNEELASYSLDSQDVQLETMDKNSVEYREKLDEYFDMVKSDEPQKRIPKNTKYMSGKNLELYMFDAKPMPISKRGNRYDTVLASFRQRRDVDPDANYAGGFVTNKALKNNKVSHWQAISLHSFNHIMDVNDKPTVDVDTFRQKQDRREKLMSKHDSISLQGNIFIDEKNRQPNGRLSYLVNVKPEKIHPSPYYFDRDYEAELDEKRRQEKERARVEYQARLDERKEL